MNNETFTLYLPKIDLRKGKRKDAFYAVVATTVILMTQIQIAFGAEDIIGRAESGIGQLVKGFYSLLTPVAGLCALISFGMILLSPGRGAEMGMTWLKRIAVAYLCAMGLQWIFNFISNIAGGTSGNFSV